MYLDKQTMNIFICITDNASAYQGTRWNSMSGAKKWLCAVMHVSSTFPSTLVHNVLRQTEYEYLDMHNWLCINISQGTRWNDMSGSKWWLCSSMQGSSTFPSTLVHNWQMNKCKYTLVWVIKVSSSYRGNGTLEEIYLVSATRFL